MPKFYHKVLVDTALLGQGLPSISDNDILMSWPSGVAASLVWLQQGRIYHGTPGRFLPVRHMKDTWRVTWNNLEQAIAAGATGFMTGSAVMKIMWTLGAKAIVTAGMGGLRNGIIDDDLIALSHTPVVYIVSAPKDSMQLEETIDWLRQNGIKILGKQSGFCSGFMFARKPVKLDGIFHGTRDLENKNGAATVLFNILEPESRWTDNSLMEAALRQAEKASQRGELFLPAVNTALDELTDGKTSRIQLAALVENIKLANQIIKSTGLSYSIPEELKCQKNQR